MKKLPDGKEFLDLWLSKYHNTNTQEVINKHPKEVLESPDWFKLYPCTQKQCDEWEKEAKELLSKKYKISKRMIENGWWLIYLDYSPYVSEDMNTKENN